MFTKNIEMREQEKLHQNTMRVVEWLLNEELEIKTIEDIRNDFSKDMVVAMFILGDGNEVVLRHVNAFKEFKLKLYDGKYHCVEYRHTLVTGENLYTRIALGDGWVK